MKAINTGNVESHLARKRILGLAVGLFLAIIVLNIDKKLWWPLELEVANAFNTQTKTSISKSSMENIVLILFGDKTQFLLRQNGLPIKEFEKKGRTLINKAIEKLEASKAAAIGINLNLSTPAGTQEDALLSKTIAKFNNIVIADSLYSSSYPISKILMSTPNVGYGELYADYDKIVHKVKLVDESNKKINAFSYVLYKVASKKDVLPALKSKNAFHLKYPNTPFVKYSFADLVHGKIKPSLLEGKIVILGINLKSKLIRDQLIHPFDRGTLVSDSEIQAVSLLNLLNKSYLLKLGLEDYSFHLVILSMILGMLFSSIPVIRGAFIGTILFIVQIVFGVVAYTNHQILIELVPLLFILFGNFVIGSLVFLQLNLQEQNIELAEALTMLKARSKELEVSQEQLKGKNVELSGTLSELHKKMEELKEVRKQLSSKSEEERKRIARELHDDTLARITDLKRHLESMTTSVNIPVSEREELESVLYTLDNITSEVRRIINALRPSMLDNVLGLIPAIESLLDDFSRRSDGMVQTKFTTSLSNLRLKEANEINLYRIVQEALNNVFKHSQATMVEVLINEQPGQILVLVRDNGIGFTSDNNKKGFGIVDMKERAELIGASMQYLSSPQNSGTTLEITIPSSEVINIEKQKQATTLS